MSELVERLRQLELRITMGANEACGQAADMIEHQAALLEEAREAFLIMQVLSVDVLDGNNAGAHLALEKIRNHATATLAKLETANVDA